jgi:Tfp pilus assembly protein PilV
MQDRLRARRAITVVEVLVALMLVSVGLLGIAGTSALTLRTATSAVHERRAMQRAAARLALLSAGGCGRAASGASVDPGTSMREQWVVAPPRAGIALAEARVEWQGSGARRSVLLRGALLC